MSKKFSRKFTNVYRLNIDLNTFVDAMLALHKSTCGLYSNSYTTGYSSIEMRELNWRNILIWTYIENDFVDFIPELITVKF